MTQASELKALRVELDSLNKVKSRQKIQREQERNSFQWLLEQISDDDDAKDFPMPPSKKRKRPVGKKQAGGAWVSDAEFDDECDDDDAALTDDMVHIPSLPDLPPRGPLHCSSPIPIPTSTPPPSPIFPILAR